MKKIIITILLSSILCCGLLLNNAEAAPVWKMPTYVIQPNGDTLHCFITGDEYYRRLHDAQDYTIIKNPQTGYYVYATMQDNKLIPSKHIAGQIDPSTIGVNPGLRISKQELMERRSRMNYPTKGKIKRPKTNGEVRTLNNILIFVKFADDPSFTTPFSEIEHQFNDSTAGNNTVYNYYMDASYQKLKIKTLFYPTQQGDSIIAYTDIHPRNYYRPYSDSNTIGYTQEEVNSRLYELVVGAVEYIDSLIPEDLDIDSDNDSIIDNITLMLQGGTSDWGEILWPQQKNLMETESFIHGKYVFTINLLMEEFENGEMPTGTICHELFHSLGAPDLYRYFMNTEVSPVGPWDIMSNTTNPPQHMGAYLKYRYGGWIDDIPVISEQGTYALAPLNKPNNHKNCYKILTPHENLYYVLEYRDTTQPYEKGLPGSGLLIYYIDTLQWGNEWFDNSQYYDEVYIYRPNAASPTEPGNDYDANFIPLEGRTRFNYTTNPHPFYTDGTIDSNFVIHNIRIEGDSLLFDFVPLENCYTPSTLMARNIYGNAVELAWEGFSDSYMLEYSDTETPSNTIAITIDSNQYRLENLEKGHTYQWRVTGICSSSQENSETTEWHTFTTMPCNNILENEIGTATKHKNTMPFVLQRNYSYLQQIFTADEMQHNAMEISKISFKYYSNTPLDVKKNCDIYLGYTDKTAFDNKNDFIPFNQLQLVYSGEFNAIKGWNSIILDSAYAYDGEQNLVLAIDDNSNTTCKEAEFYISNTENSSSIAAYDRVINPNPATIETFTSYTDIIPYRSDVRFEGCNPNGDDTRIEISDQHQVKITTSHLNIHLSSESPHDYRLYDVTGKLLQQSTNQNSCTLTVPQCGVYLLNIDNTSTEKVIIF